MWTCSCLVAQDAFFLSLPVAFFDVGALVVLFFAFGKADFELGAATGPVEVERDEGVAGAFNLADEGVQLLALEQKLAGACGVGDFVGAGLFERGDVGADEEGFAVFERDVCFGDLRTSGAQAFDFPALKGKAGFVAFFDVVVVTRTPVDGDHARGCLFFVGAAHSRIIEARLD